MSLKAPFAAAAMALIAGGVLLWFGVPRTISAFSLLPGRAVLLNIQDLNPVKPASLETLIAAQERGLTWDQSGRMWRDLGLAQLLLATSEGTEDKRRQALLADAITSFEDSLARTPANSYAWTRLAYARLLIDGASSSVVAALKMAMETAPFEPRLLLVRLDLAFRSWEYFSREDFGLIFRQIEFAWKKQPKQLVQLALDSGRVNVVRGALMRSRQDLAKFERRLKKAS